MKAARRPAVLAALLLLSGCCSNVSTDPRTGGLAGGVCGEATGAYRERIADREALLTSIDDANASLSRDLGTERRDAAALGRRLAAERQAAASERQALRRLDAEIEAAARAGRIGKAREAALKEEARALDAELGGAIRRAGETGLAVRALQRGVASAEAARDAESRLAGDEERRKARRRSLDAMKRELAETRRQ